MITLHSDYLNLSKFQEIIKQLNLLAENYYFARFVR